MSLSTTESSDGGQATSGHRRKRRFSRSRRPRGWFEPAFLIVGFVLTMLTPRLIMEGTWIESLSSVLGWGLLLAGGGMRLWASLYIGGYKDKILLMEGPYSLCRNPLYLGSVMFGVAFALLLSSGVMLVAVACVPLFYALYLVPHEERRLLEQFGDQYRRYCEQTPRFWPRWRSFRTEPVVQVHLRSLTRELRRVCLWVMVGLPVELFIDELRGREIVQMLHVIV